MNWHRATVFCSSLQHNIRTNHFVFFVALGVNERTCVIFSYALVGFLHLCQSSLETRITQKNVSHDNYVNKDNSGNSYTKMSSANRCYVWELDTDLPQATSPSKAKIRKKQDDFYIEIPSCSHVDECVILYHFEQRGSRFQQDGLFGS